MVFLVLIAAAVWWRLPLVGWILRNALTDAGVSARELRVRAVSPRHAAIAPLELAWRGQQVHVNSATLDRPEVFSRSLGKIRLDGITVVLDPGAWPNGTQPAVPANATPGPNNGTASLTFDDLAVTGGILVRGAGPLEALTFDLQAQPDASGRVVRASIKLHGPGVDATLHGTYDLPRSSGECEMTAARLNLAEATAFLTHVLPGQLAGWEVSGIATISVHARLDNAGPAGALTLHLQGGAVRNAGQKVAVDGIEGDIAALNLAALATPPGQSLKVASIRVGDVELQGLSVRYQVKNAHQLSIEAATAEVFGGKVAVDPFEFDPAVADYSVTLECDGLRMEDIMALFPTANAKASGLADGRIPMRYGPKGVTFSHGWLELKAGHPGALQINQPGLLTANLSPQNVAYGTLKAVEAGLLNLRVDTLRAEVYPPDAPAGRSVHIMIAGQPQDPRVIAPVTFEVNVNGPVEKLIQWGLDSRMKFSTK